MTKSQMAILREYAITVLSELGIYIFFGHSEPGASTDWEQQSQSGTSTDGVHCLFAQKSDQEVAATLALYHASGVYGSHANGRRNADPSQIGAASLFTETERVDLATGIALDRQTGDIMPATGGYRRRRFGRAGMVSAGEQGSYLCAVAKSFPSFSSPLTRSRRRAT